MNKFSVVLDGNLLGVDHSLIVIHTLLQYVNFCARKSDYFDTQVHVIFPRKAEAWEESALATFSKHIANQFDETNHAKQFFPSLVIHYDIFGREYRYEILAAIAARSSYLYFARFDRFINSKFFPALAQTFVNERSIDLVNLRYSRSNLNLVSGIQNIHSFSEALTDYVYRSRCFLNLLEKQEMSLLSNTLGSMHGLGQPLEGSIPCTVTGSHELPSNEKSNYLSSIDKIISFVPDLLLYS